MIVIRFLRIGKKNQPFFRIVVTEKKNPPRGGRFLEIVGFFNPFSKEKQLKADRIKYWISVGAQPSDRVHNLLVSEGIIKDKKKPVHAKAKKKKEEKPAESAAPATTEKSAEKAVDKPAEDKVKPEDKPTEKPKTEEKPEPKPKPKPKPEPKPEKKVEPEAKSEPKT